MCEGACCCFATSKFTKECVCCDINSRGCIRLVRQCSERMLVFSFARHSQRCISFSIIKPQKKVEMYFAQTPSKKFPTTRISSSQTKKKKRISTYHTRGQCSGVRRRHRASGRGPCAQGRCPCPRESRRWCGRCGRDRERGRSWSQRL
jgi:hypothetical protein